jgi:transposase
MKDYRFHSAEFRRWVIQRWNTTDHAFDAIAAEAGCSRKVVNGIVYRAQLKGLAKTARQRGGRAAYRAPHQADRSAST